ncbi:MAG: WD40/YVTN/BNR-like repeat-containing protein, partial [bacterium]
MLTKDVISIIFSIIIIPILALAQGWQPQISPRTDRNLFDIWFVSESIGCACGNFGFLIQTTDRGNTWQDRSGVTNSWIDDMCFANSWIGYAVGEAGTIIKT